MNKELAIEVRDYLKNKFGMSFRMDWVEQEESKSIIVTDFFLQNDITSFAIDSVFGRTVIVKRPCSIHTVDGVSALDIVKSIISMLSPSEIVRLRNE